PHTVLLTKHDRHRLIPVFKISFSQQGRPFSGSTGFHRSWGYEYEEGSNWNENYMPGLAAAHGYNMINVSHYDHQTNIQNSFFERPVLMKTLYYPAFSSDTLNYQPVRRDYYLVSVYDQDTNLDGFINVKDLRHFYHFNLAATDRQALVPANYSVMSSTYDSGNDYMYIYARLDENSNGQMEVEEPMHVFWVDLKNPLNTGSMYQPQ
ncbi:MAG: hypothetical protein AAFO69_19825, partial [Bacteroidota bacterium]